MGTGQLANQTGVVVRNAWKAIAATEPTLAGIAVRLHGLITRSAHPERFVTAFLANFGAGPRTEFVCCGHPPPLLLRGAQATFADGLTPSPPLGLLDLSEFEAASGFLVINPGDRVLLYTDGVTDARDASGNAYQLAERAGAVSASAGSASLCTVLTDIQADLSRFSGGRLRDDAAMLMLEVDPG
jgi:serine phosphatase RsbU (regulator of sigma subunit)